MSQLVAQSVGVVLAGLILQRLLVQTRPRFGFARAVAATTIVLLGVLSVASLRDGWHELDRLRSSNGEWTPAAAHGDCARAVGADPGFLGWVAARMPEHSTFQLYVSPALSQIYGDGCIRFLLLPRLQVNRLDDADYAVFWDEVPRSLLADVKRRGATVSTYSRHRLLARLR